MKTIAGLFWGVLVGVFFAFGIIFITQLIGAGSDLLGFTMWTYRYYVLCLGVCVGLLIFSKPVRKYWKLMLIFIVAVIMVMGIGFQSFVDQPSGQDQLAQIQAFISQLAMVLAKGTMYIAPGALTAFYVFIAYEAVSSGSKQEKLN
ncbi:MULTISPECIES: DUF3290 family protein [Pseudomonas syringae group]|uniref:Uncharacterized protein n=1 Tax=Pseudomonas syringae pv. persicae TaxID=237306 RepID=A0A3M3ZSR4_9PSED|nr:MULTISPECIES: DUF3290 family protein [Pseudomonas syringae group]RMO97707.1 hypothetical protein ALQ30_200627 [Pseudomonas syringae pv. persicae]